MKYWLVLFSQNGLQANAVIDISPGRFFCDLVRDYPDDKNILLSAVEISKAEYEELKDNI